MEPTTTGSGERSGRDSGTRVLVECEDPTIQDGVARVLREGGYAVTQCGGPASRVAGACPLVARGHCALIEDADVVVHALDPAEGEHRLILHAIRQRVPETPVVVEVAHEYERRHADLLAGCEPVRFPMTRQGLLDAVAAVTFTD
jgi:hypothetical protein